MEFKLTGDHSTDLDKYIKDQIKKDLDKKKADDDKKKADKKDDKKDDDKLTEREKVGFGN